MATFTATTHHQIHHLSFRSSFPRHPSSSLIFFPSKSRNFKILSCISTDKSNDHHNQPTTANVDFRVVLAAGGTGGHIIPAVAIAEELKSSKPGTELLFIGTPNSMESSSIPSCGYPFATIPPVKLHRPLISFQNLTLPFHLVQSVIHSLKLLKEFKPHVVVGTGGYVSFPTCIAALLKGIKIVIQEQNSVPGIANYWLSYFADVVFVAYNSTVECFPRKHKCIVSGNPVRLSLRRVVEKHAAMREFFPKNGGEEGAKVILVLGGSWGANYVNIAFLNLYSQMLLEHKNWYVIWQTGVEAFDEMESLVRNQSRLVLTPFLHSMDLAYAAADVIVSRAGAMTCSEILAMGIPAVLIPSPDIDEGHQFKNASLMADVAGSRVITEDELDSTTLRIAIEEILGNETLMAEMSERALRAARPDASGEIVQHIISLVESSIVKTETASSSQ